MSYVQGFVIPVPTAKKREYEEASRQYSAYCQKLGALQTVDNWGVDVPDGKVTDFKMAVKATPDETVVFGWQIWPDKATCDAAAQKMMADPAMMNMQMPFDGKRMIFAGFETLFDSSAR
jgi:uncharacterized protein YbaA (DUF1428 family)